MTPGIEYYLGLKKTAYTAANVRYTILEEFRFKLERYLI